MKNLFKARSLTFLAVVLLFSISCLVAFVAEGTAIMCGYTDNPSAQWKVTYPRCTTHNVTCTEWIQDPAGMTGGPYYDYCCSACGYPHINPN